jgi:hypothetical protein
MPEVVFAVGRQPRIGAQPFNPYTPPECIISDKPFELVVVPDVAGPGRVLWKR